jgi:hypothetical protein
MLLSEDGVLRYTVASDEPGRMLEALQEQFGEGPSRPPSSCCAPRPGPPAGASTRSPVRSSAAPTSLAERRREPFTVVFALPAPPVHLGDSRDRYQGDEAATA